MGKETCELCGYESEVGSIEKHHVVPREVMEQAGLPESRVVRLCCNCHRELHRWYSTKVADVNYDSETKRFRAQSWLEMVKEYQPAFDSFVKYKEEQKKRVK